MEKVRKVRQQVSRVAKKNERTTAPVADRPSPAQQVKELTAAGVEQADRLALMARAAALAGDHQAAAELRREFDSLWDAIYQVNGMQPVNFFTGEHSYSSENSGKSEESYSR